ncbi:hypothetical protein OG716_00105 [Nocardia sp. NBC_01388]
MDDLDFHRQIGAALLAVGQDGGRRTPAPGIETRPRHIQQSCQAGDIGPCAGDLRGGALRGHQLDPGRFCCIAAKYADFLRERNVLVLLRDSPAQGQQLGSFGRAQRLFAVDLGRRQPAAFVLDQATQYRLTAPEFADDFGDRAPGVDHPVRGLDFVLGRE